MQPWFKKFVALVLVLTLFYLGVLATLHLEERRQDLQEELQKLRLQQEGLKKELEKNRGLLEQAKKRWTEEQLLLQKLQQWLDTWEVVKLETTAYAPFEAGPGALCHDGNPSVTATGTLPGPGTAAVDPKEIPYGTILWVEGYGFAEALDTGAAMRNGEERLDLFFQSRAEALAWGRRSVVVALPRKVDI